MLEGVPSPLQLSLSFKDLRIMQDFTCLHVED